MIARRARVVTLWCLGTATALWVVAHARYITDLSAFLPAKPNPLQTLLVEQLRDGPASRVILAALEGGTAQSRAQVSSFMSQRLRLDPQFSSVENGAPVSAERDREFLFRHRYLLSDAINAQRFSAPGLKAALEQTIDDLGSSAGLMLKPLVPHDPTGEMLRIVDRLARSQGPRTRDGVWVSADGERTLLLAQTTAAGSDTDAQERALQAIHAAFSAAALGTANPTTAAATPTVAPTSSSATATTAEVIPTATASATATPASTVTPPSTVTPARSTAIPPTSAANALSGMHLTLSGPAVFAVAARAKIKGAAVRLSIISSLLVVGVLLAVYRSLPALLLGLLPVATGALIGIAAVALGFGAVHAITLGFGITLIGESVDYSIYFFIQSSQALPQTHALAAPQLSQLSPAWPSTQPSPPSSSEPSPQFVQSTPTHRYTAASTSERWERFFWPTIRLGMLTSICGFASLLPSGFPGLAQLGLYSICGLLAAAWVTRFLLPELKPHGFKIRDLTPWGLKAGRIRDAIRGLGGGVIASLAAVLALITLSILHRHADTLWNRELSALSPISSADLDADARLRADLGTANVLDLVVISGISMESVLEGAERAGAALQSLVDAGVIGDFDSPATYLPSLAVQRARRDALPDAEQLRNNLRVATRELDLRADSLSPFIDDVQAARQGALLSAADLRGTSLAVGFNALVLQKSGRWSALLPLHSPTGADGRPDAAIDVARVGAALAAAQVPQAQVLDLKAQTDALYADYLHEAMRLSAAGFALIVLLLGVTLRSARRVARVLAPLCLAVLTVAAALTLAGERLTLLHLVGMLLIIAIGSNYALFFDRDAQMERNSDAALTLASLGLANLSTVIGFGLLAFSQVPVLTALGVTVAPGALLALLFSALLISGSPRASRPAPTPPVMPIPSAPVVLPGRPVRSP